MTQACNFDDRQRPDVPILSDVSLSVAPGQVLGLVGTSGSGKSTLGNSVSGLKLLVYEALS